MARKNKINSEDLVAKKKTFEKIAANLEEISSDDFLKDNFLPYSWSYTLDRALTDVSGLKPVQRRILYFMFKEGLNHNSNRSKVATLAGKVLALHPHGDASVSDALKNMARDHVFRVPLIDGKGDFGSPGLPGAAGRYIEARLSEAAWINVEEISEKAVLMVPNYDNTMDEPVKIPVKWPVSVINGGSGIAVAYASNMPSHNPTEIMKACIKLAKYPNTTTEQLSKIILGPDFNMGGIITSNDGIKEYLETGSGSFKIRGQHNISTGERNKSKIEFDEIPFGTYPEKIIQEIQKASEKGHFKEISSYKDLSDLKHPIRIVIETKPSTNVKKVLQDLFKMTSLETNFSSNITTIVDNKPVQSSMKNLLLDFIKFRKECIRNKTNYQLTKLNKRQHILEGLTNVLLDIDKAISIIRNSENTTTANKELQQSFKIDNEQAEHVLSLQLRRLTKMDKLELEQEKKEIAQKIEQFKKLLTDEDYLVEHLTKEFKNTLKIIGDERKTEINDLTQDEFIEEQKKIATQLKNSDKNSPCFITRFKNGTILKTTDQFTYSLGTKKFTNSPIIEQLLTKTKEDIVIVDSSGIGHRIPVSYIPENKAVNISQTGIKLKKGIDFVGFAKYQSDEKDYGLSIGTKNGLVKVSKTDFPKNDETFPVITLEENDRIVNTNWVENTENSYISFITKNGNILLFETKNVRASGSKAGGIKGIKLKGINDEVISFQALSNYNNPNNVVLTFTGQTLKSTLLSEIPTKSKGGMGVSTQIFKRGETEIKDAFVGVNVIITPEQRPYNEIMTPAITKRTQRGTDFNFNVLIGSKDLTNPIQSQQKTTTLI